MTQSDGLGWPATFFTWGVLCGSFGSQAVQTAVLGFPLWTTIAHTGMTVVCYQMARRATHPLFSKQEKP